MIGNGNPVGTSFRQLIGALFDAGGGKKASPELLAQLSALGHSHISVSNLGPAHPVLGQSRQSLSQLRIPIQEASNMELIKFGKLEPRLVSNSDFEPPKVNVDGKLKLLESLTHQERIALFADVGAVWHPPQHPNISLHRAEQRAIQDYMSAPDQSKRINHFLRGGIAQNLGLKTPKDLREFALLMISGLNALPSQTVICMHTLPANSPMFKSMVEAAQTGKPFSPDYFLSVTPLSEAHAADQHTPPNRSLGDTAILIRSNIAKDVSSVNQIYAQEKESIIPPYVSFQVKPVKSDGANRPALELVEDTTLKNPATVNRK